MRNDDSYEQTMREEINRQAETDPSIDWGNNMRILLISDSAPGRAEAIKDYLTAKTQISEVKLCSDFDSANSSISESPPDAVVYIGMQTAPELYQLVQMLKGSYAETFFCMYAHLDPIVKDTCQKHGIKDIFPDKEPVADFIRFLQTMIERTKAK